MLIISRLIAGTFGSSPLANAGGSLADIWMVRSHQFRISYDSHVNGEKRCLSSQQLLSLGPSLDLLLVASSRNMVSSSFDFVNC